MRILETGFRCGEDTCRNLKTLTWFISDFVSLHAFTASKSGNVDTRGNLFIFRGKSKGFRSWQTWIQIPVQALVTIGKTRFVFLQRVRDIE